MNEDTVMPDWLHDIFLGYGDPAQAKYTNMPKDQLLQTIDFKVTLTPSELVVLQCSVMYDMRLSAVMTGILSMGMQRSSRKRVFICVGSGCLLVQLPS